MTARPEHRYGLPEFQIPLPPPWALVYTTPEEYAKEDAKASAVFKQAGRPDLDAQYRMLSIRARQRMSKSKVFATIRQQDIELDEFLPLSISLAKIESAGQESLDGFMSEQVRQRGAAPLEHAPWVMHWAEEHVGEGDVEGLTGRTLSYAIAAPETDRRQAILITATIANPGLDDPESVYAALGFFVDSLVRSFSWIPGTGQPATSLRDEIRGA